MEDKLDFDENGCYLFDFETRDDYKNDSSSEEADTNHEDRDLAVDVPNAPSNTQSLATNESSHLHGDELPQTSSADTVLILNELRKINATVECLSDRLSSTEKSVSSLKKKLGKNKKTTGKIAVDIPIEVRVSTYYIICSYSTSAWNLSRRTFQIKDRIQYKGQILWSL